MERFKVIVITPEGKKKPVYVDADDSKQAINRACTKLNLEYCNVISVKSV